MQFVSLKHFTVHGTAWNSQHADQCRISRIDTPSSWCTSCIGVPWYLSRSSDTCQHSERHLAAATDDDFVLTVCRTSSASTVPDGVGSQASCLLVHVLSAWGTRHWQPSRQTSRWRLATTTCVDAHVFGSMPPADQFDRRHPCPGCRPETELDESLEPSSFLPVTILAPFPRQRTKVWCDSNNCVVIPANEQHIVSWLVVIRPSRLLLHACHCFHWTFRTAVLANSANRSIAKLSEVAQQVIRREVVVEVDCVASICGYTDLLHQAQYHITSQSKFILCSFLLSSVDVEAIHVPSRWADGPVLVSKPNRLSSDVLLCKVPAIVWNHTFINAEVFIKIIVFTKFLLQL